MLVRNKVIVFAFIPKHFYSYFLHRFLEEGVTRLQVEWVVVVEESFDCHCLGAGEGPPLVSGLLAGGLSSSLRWCQHTPANMANYPVQPLQPFSYTQILRVVGGGQCPSLSLPPL